MSNYAALLTRLQGILELHTAQGANETEIAATQAAIERVKARMPLDAGHEEQSKSSSAFYGIVVIKGYARYNGKTFSFDTCDDPANLVEGKIYAITKIDILDSAMMYHLMDPLTGQFVDGRYNCTWFDECNPQHGEARTVPEEGKDVYLLDGRVLTDSKKVTDFGNGEYLVMTGNSIFYVNVI